MITSRRFYLKQPPEPFRGTICGSHFRVVRVLGIWWRNSFLPVVIGDIVQGPSGTEVRVRMRLHAFVAAGMTLWFASLFVIGGGFIYSAMRRSERVGAAAAASIGAMALFAYGLMSIAFWTEVTRARVLLRDSLGVDDRDVVEG